MTKYVLPALLAVSLCACKPSLTKAGVSSFAQTSLTKATTSIALDWSSLGQPGRLAIADVLSYSGDKPTITAPAGWTPIRDDSTSSVRQSLYWHVIQANEKSAQTWTFSEPVDAQGAIVLLSDVATVDPVDAAGRNTGGGAPTAASVTTTSDGDLILAFYATDFNGTGPGHDCPDNMSLVVDQTQWTHPYWILAARQNRRGATEEAVCRSPQGFSWVAAQVAIRLRGVTAGGKQLA